MLRALVPLLACLFLLLPGRAHADDLSGLKDGFRGLAWETKLRGVPGMKRVLTGDKLVRNAVRPKDDPVVAGVRTAEIRYQSFEGKFFRVEIRTKGYEPSKALLHALYKRFGPPTSYDMEHFRNVDVWRAGDVEIRSVYFDDDMTGVTTIAHAPSARRLEAAE